MQGIERTKSEPDKLAGAALNLGVQRHIDCGAVDPEGCRKPAALSGIRVVLDQMGGRPHKGDLTGLGLGEDGRNGGRLLADAGLSLVVERSLERAHVEIDPLHSSALYARGVTDRQVGDAVSSTAPGFPSIDGTKALLTQRPFSALPPSRVTGTQQRLVGPLRPRSAPPQARLDFAGATQVFAFAGFKPITTTEGVQVVPGDTFEGILARPIEILFVPGGGEQVSEVMIDPVFVSFVREAARRAQYEVTTYWSQRENLALFPNIKVSAGYPRWVIHGNRFTGGGISSSIDLALEPTSLISGATQSMTTQLSTQYAPAPPFSSGDPSQAPPEVTAAVRQQQGDFLATIRLAVEKVVSGEPSPCEA